MTDVTVSIGGEEVNVSVEGGSLNPSLQAIQDAEQQAEAAAVAAQTAAAQAIAAAAASGSASAQAAALSAADAAEDANQADLSAQAAALSEADAEAAAADAADAASQAQAAEDAAAAYASAVPPNITYDTDAAGRTGVGVDGGVYWLRTTDGLRLKTRVNSTTSADVLSGGQPIILITVNGLYTKMLFVKCTVTALGAGNSYTITPVDANVRYSGTGTQYVWVWQAPAANSVPSGSVDVTIKDGAGTTFATINLRKRGNATLDGSEFQAGDLIMARRQTAAETPGQQLLWMAAPDTGITVIPPTYRANDILGFNPSKDRPLFYFKNGPNQHYITMRLAEGAYGSGLPRRHSDMVRAVEHDMASFQGDTGNVGSLNSLFSRVGGLANHDLNMLFERLIGGATVDTGRPPTIIEVPFQGGKFGDPTNLYVVVGPGHGGMVNPTTTYAATLNDFTTGGLDVVTMIDPNAPYGTSFFGNKIVKTLATKLENLAGDIFCYATWTVTYDPNNTTDGQIRVQSKYDFTHPSITVTPGFMRTSAFLFAQTDADRCRPIVNGVPGPITTIDFRNDVDTVLASFPEKVIFWHSSQPTKQWVVKANFPYGFSHKENGVNIAQGPGASYVDNFDWGTKMYANPVGDQSAVTPRNMTGIIMEYDSYFLLKVDSPQV